MTTPDPTYLGDGVDARFDGFMIELSAQGEEHVNRIWLDPDVLAALFEYAKQCWPSDS